MSSVLTLAEQVGQVEITEHSLTAILLKVLQQLSWGASKSSLFIISKNGCYKHTDTKAL